MASIVIRRLVEPNCVMNGTATGLGRHANPRGALQFVVKRAARYWRRDLSRQAPHGSMDMRRLPILILTAAAACASAGLAAAEPADAPRSIYTSLAEPACKVIEIIEEEASAFSRCPGAGGYSLLLIEHDDRMSLTIVAPDASEHPLDFFPVVTEHFATLGSTVEWRVSSRGAKIVPRALIARVNAEEHQPESAKATSYLAVSKITAQAICVTDRIAPGLKANEQARHAADTAGTRPCLSERSPAFWNR